MSAPWSQSYVVKVVEAQRLLASEPRSPDALALALGVGRRTVERLLAGLLQAGEPVTRLKEGGRVTYSLTR